jgi:hypothetical protein
MKNLFLTVMLMACSMLMSVRCVDVKGVDSRKVKWSDDNNEVCLGFELKNKNHFAVTVELELWRQHYRMEPAMCKDTKKLALPANELSVWYTPIPWHLRDAWFVKYKVLNPRDGQGNKQAGVAEQRITP